MGKCKPSVPLPVDGVVFSRSETKTLAYIVSWALIWFLGLELVWKTIIEDVQVDVKRLFLGIGLLLASPLVIIRQARSWWVRHRLIIGLECLQEVEHLGGQDTVVLQIPYANIAKFEHLAFQSRARINLVGLDDINTYARTEDFEKNRQSDGWHYYIKPGYRGKLSDIAAEIERAYRMSPRQDEEPKWSQEPFANPPT